MKDFYNKLHKYIMKNEGALILGIAPHFSYKETTSIEPKVANEIYCMYTQLKVIKDLWDKEKDYSRLLKKENIELQDKLNALNTNEEDNDDMNNINENEGNNYLS